MCGLLPSIGDARKFTANSVIFPLFTFKFHSPVRMTLNASVILKPDSGTVITRELIWPIAEKVVILLLLLLLFPTAASRSSELEEVVELVLSVVWA
jgi:hypothetical protein